MEQELTREEIHRELFQMLCAFADYCEENGLRYYLVGGTLLGAVRHQGFIPWDDDIDVGMPRPDYERFLDLVKEKPVGAYLEVRSDREDTLSTPFAELHNNRIRLERPTSEFIGEDFQILHLFLDIFPQDGWPSDPKKASCLAKLMDLLRYLNTCSRAKLFHGTSISHMLAKTPAVLLARLLSNRRLLKLMQKIAKRYPYDRCKYVGCTTYGIYGTGERCLRREVTDFKEVKFEGRAFKAPGCTDSYLTGIFGDYRVLPLREERVSHGLRAWKQREDNEVLQGEQM